jgi:hypothetical protein
MPRRRSSSPSPARVPAARGEASDWLADAAGKAPNLQGLSFAAAPPAWVSRALAQQELERRAVEGLGVLVQPGVRQVIEDHRLTPGDPALQRLDEARGADEVPRTEGRQGRKRL